MPHIDKAIGVVPEDQEAFEHHLIELYEKLGGQWLEEWEVPKTEREREILALADQAATKYMREYGRTRDLSIKEENIHILRPGGTAELSPHSSSPRRNIGIDAAQLGVVLLDREQSELEFAIDAFHELYHAKSYKKVQVLHDKPVIAPASQGFSITSRDGTITYFWEIEEALTSLMEERFYRDVLDHDERFRNEFEARQGTERELKFGYPEQRRRFMNLIEQLWQANDRHFGGRFKDKQEILDVFFRAQATGRKLPVARTLEKAYGPGSFRLIGEDTAQREQGEAEEVAH